MPEKIRSQCPSCHQTLKVAESMMGRNVRCPSCEHRFVLSSLEQSQAASKAVSAEVVSSSSSISIDGDGTQTGKTHHPAKSEPSIGTIGRFDLKEEVGQGGFGKVFRAYDPQLDRQVALKVPKFGPKDKKRIRRFLAEARTAASLRHPNIVPVYERGRVNGEYYIASEFVNGETISDCIEVQQPSFHKAALWVRDLALALNYAHTENVIHRDIKSDNIMLGTNQRPQIMDFGLAKRLDEDSSMTADGGLLGTPAYMSPEQARGETKRVGPASDQYSLGVVLFELLTGRKPFEGPPHSVLAKVTLEEPPVPKSINSDVPDDLQAICLKAMSKEIDHRYANLLAMAEDLDNWLEGYETVARPIKPHERFMRWCRRNPMTAGLTTAFVVTLLLGVIVSSYFAIAANHERKLVVEQRDLATKAQNDAEKEKKVARLAQQKAETQTRLATRRLAESQFDNAMSLLKEGKPNQAFALLCRSGQTANAEKTDLQRTIRLNLAMIRIQPLGYREYVAHSDRIVASDYNRDGTKVVTGSSDGFSHVWDPRTGVTLSPPIPLKMVKYKKDNIGIVRFTPDGKQLATSGDGGGLKFWDWATGKAQGAIAMPGNIMAVSSSSDGKTYITGDTKGGVQLWDANTLESIAEIPQIEGIKRNGIRQVLFSPNNQLIAVAPREGGNSKKIQLWDASTRRPLEKQLPNYINNSFVAFSPNNRFLAVAGYGDSKGHVWDIAAGKFVGKPQPNMWGTQALAFSPDSEWFVTLGHYDGMSYWETTSGQMIHPTYRHRCRLMTLSPSSDGQYLLTGDVAGRARIWEVSQFLKSKSGEKNTASEKSVPLTALTFSSSAKYLAASRGTSVQIWDAKKNELIREVAGFLNAVDDDELKFSEDDRFLIATKSSKVQVLDMESQGNTNTKFSEPFGHRDLIYHYDISEDNKYLATASRDSSVRIWDLASRQQVGKPLWHGRNQNVWAVRFRPGTTELVSVTNGGEFRRWDLKTGEQIGKPQNFLKGFTWPIGFSPSLDKVFTTHTGQRKMSLWSWSSDGWTSPIRILDRRVRESKNGFSDDGKHLLIGDAEFIKVWNTSTAAQTGRTIHFSEAVDRFYWATGQKEFIFTKTAHGIAQLWSTRTGKPIGATIPISSGSGAAIDAQGQMIAYQSRNGNLVIQAIPKPYEGSLDTLQLEAEVKAGQDLTAEGEFRHLNHEEWYTRLKKLRKLDPSAATR